MKTSDFDFKLPEKLLAVRPANYRDEARLMVVNRKTGSIEHKVFKDLIDYFNEDDVLIFNNTKVFPARLYGNKEKTGAKIEVFLLRELDAESKLWDVLVDPARKIRIGNKLFFDEDESLVAEVVDNTTSRGRTLRFLFEGSYEEFRKKLQDLGHTPLPKYMNREADADDADRYQTIFAEEEGAVAAPTAGLHFSKHLLKRLEIKGVDFGKVTLHIGLGTFAPVEVEDLTKHKMESERVIITQETSDLVNRAKSTRSNVCAVGTTTMRAIESSVSANGLLSPYDGWTNKYIHPPYDFSVATSMITNFHMPKSTLLMMVSAFAGHELIMEAYNLAVKEEYKFYSYGDAMLIL
ncbi:MAG: tRNA preQ1(34) S-adenosylmethionine ribosyltransferase-isomerase QueA [Weeksellaceae bacterium]|nr:tRNA preQ1(34) S-adenosylmethionine ribosyltransferase-isomerase QueA [Weeksellaceae bacterium]